MKKLLLLLLIMPISVWMSAQYYSFTDLNGTVNVNGNNRGYENNLYDLYQIFSTGAERIKLCINTGETGWFSEDYIYVYDGPDDCWSPLIGVYNSHNLPPDTIFSTSCFLTICFVTDNVDNGELGWSADYYGIKPLTTVYKNTTGTFTSQTIPENLFGSFFSYLIKPTGVSNVKLTFTDIYLSYIAGPYLYVYDGEDETATLIGIYGADNMPPSVIQSNGNSLFIQYFNYGNASYWTAQYTGISQNQEVTFDYDASGNRLHRNLIILPATKSTPLKPAKQPDKKQPDKPYKDKSGNTDITIYPNPTSGELKVEIANFDFTQQSAIYVFNTTGKLILQKSPATGMDVIDLSTYANGLYLMKIVLGDKASEWKILKE